ncbi:aminodeoxychorismate lyase [Thiolapillus brandeum]|uniref:Aminodeoxychorismate lyase n=1 Tax=Thiolapillus brandeum TaxID=1076588 RepID=A0A7U6GIP6_9GAMM|nr:aminodeoxychorismate lyase [Thiolapillus brandeum]BAO44359.1 4-amino-4-deoxychorismate lyase [Thiolapillus brandeum]
MIASLVNGAPGNRVSILDRGLQFGDGLFETLAVNRNQPCLWQAHMRRLETGCARLGIAMPAAEILKQESRQLLGDLEQAVLKITITRGSSMRGYAPADGPVTRILSLFSWDGPATGSVPVSISSWRLGLNPSLAGLKHLNRLEQVMARRALPPNAREAILMDIDDRVVEGIAANLFLQQDERLLTPRINDCGVAGVVRQLILDTAADMGVKVEEAHVDLDALLAADGLYLSSSLLGIRPVKTILGEDWRPSVPMHPLLQEVQSRIFQA